MSNTAHDRFMKAAQLAYDVTKFARSKTAQEVAARSPEAEAAVADLQARTARLYEQANRERMQADLHKFVENGEAMVAAGTEWLDPAKFRRKVQIRRRLAAAQQKRAAGQAPARRRRRTVFDVDPSLVEADHSIAGDAGPDGGA